MIATTQIRAQDDEFDAFDDDDDEEPEPIAKRQFNAMRDTFRNVLTGSFRFLSNGRLIKGVQTAIQAAASRPAPTAVAASSATNAVSAAAASQAVANAFRTMRSAWVKRGQQGQNQVRKRLAQITKRLTNSRVILGNIGGQLHKLSNREESAEKETKADPKPAEVKTEIKYVPLLPQFIPVPVYPHW